MTAVLCSWGGRRGPTSTHRQNSRWGLPVCQGGGPQLDKVRPQHVFSTRPTERLVNQTRLIQRSVLTEFDGAERDEGRRDRPPRTGGAEGWQSRGSSTRRGCRTAPSAWNRAWDDALAAGRLRAVVHDGIWFHLSTPPRSDGSRADPGGPLHRRRLLAVALNLFTVPPHVRSSTPSAEGWLAHGQDPLDGQPGPHLSANPPLRPRVAEAFLRVGNGRPMLLPRITALGALDETPLALTGLSTCRQPWRRCSGWRCCQC